MTRHDSWWGAYFKGVWEGGTVYKHGSVHRSVYLGTLLRGGGVYYCRMNKHLNPRRS